MSDTEKKIETENKEKKVIALAFQGQKFSSKFLLCWTNTLSFLWQSGNYEFLIANGDNASIFHSRLRTLGLNNQVHKPFNGAKYDYWITIDNNILFTPQQLLDMIKSLDEHDVVSGLYKSEDAVNFFAIKELDNDYFKENGSYKYLTQEDLDNWKKEMDTKYVPVDFVGLSFFGVKSNVLEKLNYPYFNGENIVMDKYNIVPSEDYNLCKNIKKAGYTIMLNTDIRLGIETTLII